MSMKKTHDICVAVGKYTDRNGAEKKRWLNVGRVMTGDDGGKMHILERTFNPSGVPIDKYEGVVLCMFECKDKDSTTNGVHKGMTAQGDIPASNPVETDEIPFN